MASRIDTIRLEGKKILISAFEPFAGRKVNMSELVAEELKSYMQPTGLDIEIVILPVVYDLAATKFINHIEKMRVKPDYVLSLGEAAKKLTLETKAVNLDNSGENADNAGKLRDNEEIIEGGKECFGFTMPMHLLYASVPKQNRGMIEVSSNAGSFVCNNTAYRMLNYFENKLGKYGFIHVPAGVKECKKFSDPAMNAKIIAEMIICLYQRDGKVGEVEFIKKMPTDYMSVDKLCNRLADRYRENEQYCSFFERLLLTYDEEYEY